MYGAIEGTIFLNELTRSASTSKTGLLKDVIHHMMSIRNGVVTNGLAGANNGNYIINAKEAIVKSLSLSVQSTDPVEVYLYFEPSSLSVPHEYYAITRCNELKSTVVGTFDNTIDTPIYTGFCGINGTMNVDLSQYRITIPPGSWVSIAVKSTNSVSPCIAALTWSED
jgi:hypothetical protein